MAREVQAKFPRCEGWETQPFTSPEQQNFLFQVSRYHRGKSQVAIVSASLKQKPSQGDVPLFKPGARNHRTLVGRFLIFPRGADISALQDYIEVLPMSSFGFIGGELVWLTKKKNAMKFAVSQETEA